METEQVGNYSVTEFAEGFVHGLQKYENQTSKCSTDMQKIQGIVNDAKDIIEQIKDGKFDFSKLAFFFYNAWSTLNTIEDSCHFYKLALELKSLILNPVALIIKLAWLIFVGSWSIIPCAFRVLIGLIWGNSYNAGLNLGKIIKIAFDYEIE
jgi:hypothetical protein